MLSKFISLLLFIVHICPMRTQEIFPVESQLGRDPPGSQHRLFAAPTGLNAVESDGETRTFIKVGGFRDGFTDGIFDETESRVPPDIAANVDKGGFDSYDDNQVADSRKESPLVIPKPYRSDGSIKESAETSTPDNRIAGQSPSSGEKGPQAPLGKMRALVEHGRGQPIRTTTTPGPFAQQQSRQLQPQQTIPSSGQSRILPLPPPISPVAPVQPLQSSIQQRPTLTSQATAPPPQLPPLRPTIGPSQQPPPQQPVQPLQSLRMGSQLSQQIQPQQPFRPDQASQQTFQPPGPTHPQAPPSSFQPIRPQFTTTRPLPTNRQSLFRPLRPFQRPVETNTLPPAPAPAPIQPPPPPPRVSGESNSLRTGCSIVRRQHSIRRLGIANSTHPPHSPFHPGRVQAGPISSTGRRAQTFEPVSRSINLGQQQHQQLDATSGRFPSRVASLAQHGQPIVRTSLRTTSFQPRVVGHAYMGPARGVLLEQPRAISLGPAFELLQLNDHALQERSRPQSSFEEASSSFPPTSQPSQQEKPLEERDKFGREAASSSSFSSAFIPPISLPPFKSIRIVPVVPGKRPSTKAESTSAELAASFHRNGGDGGVDGVAEMS